ncbi:MAG: class I SAM-dependent methyltransferase [Vicinamibacterales bacterium]|nr:class I SAM-dependent methyltransferase [Vicinamibacterales bacterium]
MRVIDQEAIEQHGAERFRSEYHYAVFEYWRSAKLLRYLTEAGITTLGRVLDDGCGGGGMSVSFAEEAESVVGIDLADRFRDAGERLSDELEGPRPLFSQADGAKLPFRDACFDLVVSHAVIEHVQDPLAYLLEARRVLRPGGRLFLETAPYLSPSGVHLPRLRFPIPPHLLLGRRMAFRLVWWLARHAPGTFRAPVDGSSFLARASRGETKIDDLYYLVTLRNLREHIAAAGFKMVREDLEISRLARRALPPWLVDRIPHIPIGRDVLITNMEYVLSC